MCLNSDITSDVETKNTITGQNIIIVTLKNFSKRTTTALTEQVEYK